MNNEAITKVRDAKMRYENAMKSGNMVAQTKQAYINTLVSYAGDLLDAIDEGKQYEEQLNLEVAESMKLRSELAKSKESKSKKTDSGN